MSKKKKKKSIAEQASEAIHKRLELKGIDVSAVVGITVKELKSKNCFGGIDKDGITIYEFTPKNELIKIDSFDWNNYESVTIDHFAMKSVLVFKNDGQERKIVINDGNGRDIENILRQNTDLKVNLVERKWYNKIIGFRSKKRWKMIVASLVYLMIFSVIVNAVSGNDNKAKKEPETKEVVADQNNEENKEEKKEEKKRKKEEERLDNRSIDEALEEDHDSVDDAVLEDGIMTLTLKKESSWSENTLFDNVYGLFEAIHDAFEDDDVNEVNAIIKTLMIDNKGNESIEPVINYTYTRETFEELNYDKFSEMAYVERWRILNESDAYFVHPGIYNNLKDDYKNNLSHGKSKVRN